jgi:hypothetical protein
MKLLLGLQTSGGLPSSVIGHRRMLGMAAGAMEAMWMAAKAAEMRKCVDDGQRRWSQWSRCQEKAYFQI